MLENLRVTLKGTQNIERNFSVTNINLQGNLKAFNLNGNEILQIGNSNGDNNVTDHLLSGRITRVKKLLVKGFIDTTHGINGYNLSRLLENGIRISEPNSVNGDIAFENIVYLNSLNVTNSMDGINLKNLAADIAMKQSHVFISGVKKFSTLRVLRDVKTKYLNNHLIQEIVTLKGDQAMKDSVKIIGNVIIRGNVTTNGNINNISILHLLKKYSTHYNSYIFMKDLKLNSIAISVQNMLVSGTIQNVSFGDLVKNAVAKEESCNITGNTLFKGEVNSQ